MINIAWYKSRANIPLSMKFVTIEKWLEAQKQRTVPGDEITVFVLSVIFRRHTIVFTKTKPWCTVEVDCNDTATDVINKCETILLYLGPQLFGVLRPHPFTIWPPRGFDLRVIQGLRSVDREDGQLLIEKPLDLSKTSTIKLVCDKIKIPLANNDILTRNNELKSKAKERPPPPVVELSDDEPDRETVSLVGSFGLMAGYKEFVERDLDPAENVTHTDTTVEEASVLPEATPGNKHLLTSPLDIVSSNGQSHLPDATDNVSKQLQIQLPDATVYPENDSTYTELIPDATHHLELSDNIHLPGATCNTDVRESNQKMDMSINSKPESTVHLGVRDHLISGHVQASTIHGQHDSNSDTESISLLTGEPVIRDKDDWNLSINLNEDSDSDANIDPLFRYYIAPTKNGDDYMYLHYEDITNRKCVVKMKKLKIDDISDQFNAKDNEHSDDAKSDTDATGCNWNLKITDDT